MLLCIIVSSQQNEVYLNVFSPNHSFLSLLSSVWDGDGELISENYISQDTLQIDSWAPISQSEALAESLPGRRKKPRFFFPSLCVDAYHRQRQSPPLLKFSLDSQAFKVLTSACQRQFLGSSLEPGTSVPGTDNFQQKIILSPLTIPLPLGPPQVF